MNKYIRFLFPFILGVIFTVSIVMAWFFSGIKNTAILNERKSKRTISTDFFKNDLKKACQYLERNGCECNPMIDIGANCNIKVPNLIGEVYLSSPGTTYYDQSD